MALLSRLILLAASVTALAAGLIWTEHILARKVAGTAASIPLGEVGENDFRISNMGPDGDAGYDAYSPALAYNSREHQYLIAWSGDDDTGPLANEEFEVFGQFLDSTGREIGGDFRISDMGPDGTTDYAAWDPAVAYNAQNNQYLVVWWGEDEAGSLNNEEFEVFGQRLDGSGAELGEDFRISHIGPDGDVNFTAQSPAVAYNNTDNEYLVVWWGYDSGEVVVVGQRLDASTGAEIGPEFWVGDPDPDDPGDGSDLYPDLAYNPRDNEYLVVWYRVPGAGIPEIYGQRLAGESGAAVGSDFRISNFGDWQDVYGAFDPAVAYNAMDHEFLVIWHGNDITGGPPWDNGIEIFGQRLSAAGEGRGVEFRISEMGPNRDPDYAALSPAITYNPAFNEYLVVWYGDDDAVELVDNEFEIFGRRLEGNSGLEIGSQFRLSSMGPDGNATYTAVQPAAQYNHTHHEYLVVWSGDTNESGLVNNEAEIFGQRLDYWGEVYFPFIPQGR